MALYAIKPAAPAWGVAGQLEEVVSGGEVCAAAAEPVEELSLGEVRLVMESLLVEVRQWVADDSRLSARLVDFYTRLLDQL